MGPSGPSYVLIMIAMDLIKSVLILVVLIFVFSIFFTFLFKVGLIVLLALGIIYLYKKITDK